MAETVFSICTYSVEVAESKNADIKHVVMRCKLVSQGNISLVMPTDYLVTFSDGAAVAVPYAAEDNVEAVLAKAHQSKGKPSKNTLLPTTGPDGWGPGSNGFMLLIAATSLLSLTLLGLRLRHMRAAR